MKTILRNWTLMRCLRLVIGIVALVQALWQKDVLLGLMSGFLLVTAIANVGCCGANGCAVSYKPQQRATEAGHEAANELLHQKN